MSEFDYGEHLARLQKAPFYVEGQAGQLAIAYALTLIAMELQDINASIEYFETVLEEDISRGANDGPNR
jgi:hypothetical protein